MTEPAEIAAVTQPKNQFETVALSCPIHHGEQVIEKVTLRKPKASELRGLSLQDILTTDISAIMQIIPRISDPVLLPDDVDNLDAADLAEIGGVIRGFFMTAAEKKAIERYIAERQPKT